MHALICLAAVAVLPAADSLTLTISAGPVDRPAGPVVVPVTVPAMVADGSATWQRDGGAPAPAQLTAPGLASAAAAGQRELHLILPAMKAGETITAHVHF